MKKRFLCLLLVLIAIFSSCAKKGETTPAATDTGIGEITLIENGKSEYVIVYADDHASATVSAATAIKLKIQSLTGARLEVIAESTAREEGKTGKMILLGQTEFSQSKDALNALPCTCSDEFIIRAVEGMIVINSHFETALTEAVRVFTEEAISYDGNTGKLSVTTVLREGATPLPTGFDADSIGIYTIVYASQPTGLEPIANSLAESIKVSTGKTLEVVKDTTSKEKFYEILIGPTNRSISQKCYANSSNIMRYEMVLEEGKLQFVVGGPYSGMKCVEKFNSRVLAKKEHLSTGVTYYATELATDSQVRTSGTDIRVMSSNVLNYNWGEKSYANIYPVATRCEIYAGVLLRFRPDIIGAQEVDEKWRDALPYYLNSMAEKEDVHYTHLLRNVSLNGRTVVNYSSILYRSDLYDLDDSGCEIFEANYQTSYAQRVGTYAKFTSKLDPEKQAILVNTHWAHETEENIQSCIDEEADLVNRLKEQYPGVPVFCTGDFNSDVRKKAGDQEGDPSAKNRYQFFLDFVSAISGTISSSAAKTKGVLITPGGCRASAQKINESTERAIDNDFIDHNVVSGGYAELLRHDTIRSNGCHVMSDHSPIYADFSLTQAS